MSIIGEAPNRCNQGTEVARFARWTRYADMYLQGYTHTRLRVKFSMKQTGRPDRRPKLNHLVIILIISVLARVTPEALPSSL